MKNAIKTNGSQEKAVLGSPKEDERWGKGQLSSEKANGENGENKENWELKERGKSKDLDMIQDGLMLLSASKRKAAAVTSISSK
ncbi:hypothetical protein D5086_013624 [Populus alba]|uniref:Uncharacterized protein n=1 Tax=Populus alba TaxID=43335 RepID=A0ACC4C7D0_POPAL